MAGRWIYYSVMLGMLISNTQSSEENCNTTTADIIITNSEGLKKIEVRNNRNSTNLTSSYPQSPGIIQQGNNVFIRPKFILGSPFTSYKHDYIQNDDKFSAKSKDLGAGPGIVVEKPEKTQLPPIFVPNRPPAFPVLPPPPPTLPPLPPTFVVPRPPPPLPPFRPSFPLPHPPVFIPAPIPKVSLPIPHPPQFPIAFPNLCHSMPCPPNIVPIRPYFPRLLAPPIVVQRPVYPLILKPESPPNIVPKLPIKIVVQGPSVPISNHSIIRVPCQPCGTPRCNAERESSMDRLFNEIYKKYRNMMNDAYGNDTTTEPTTDEPTTINNNGTDATLCAQGIIENRVVPNIVTNNNIKVYMTPISPYHVAHSYNYGK